MQFKRISFPAIGFGGFLCFTDEFNRLESVLDQRWWLVNVVSRKRQRIRFDHGERDYSVRFKEGNHCE